MRPAGARRRRVGPAGVQDLVAHHPGAPGRDPRPGRRPARQARRGDRAAAAGGDGRHHARSPRRCRCRSPSTASGVTPRGAMPRTPSRSQPSVDERDAPLAPGGLIGAVAIRQPVGCRRRHHLLQLPADQPGRQDGPALAMGNTVVVKPAPQDPLDVFRDRRGAARGRLPTGRGQHRRRLRAGGRRGAHGARRDVDMVSFTGSTAVGRHIASGRRDGDEAPADGARRQGRRHRVRRRRPSTWPVGISSTWTFHSGQICTAPTRR